jgi:hypothetical protein
MSFESAGGSEWVPENEAIVRRFFEELWNEGDLRVADELVAPDHVHHVGGEELRGPDGAKGVVTGLQTAFPDLRFEIDDVISDGDQAAVRWTASGPTSVCLLICSRLGDASNGQAPTGSGSTMVGSSTSGPSRTEKRCKSNSPPLLSRQGREGAIARSSACERAVTAA